MCITANRFYYFPHVVQTGLLVKHMRTSPTTMYVGRREIRTNEWAFREEDPSWGENVGDGGGQS